MDYKVTKEDNVYYAHLNCRAICWPGATEHEAVRGLLNGVEDLIFEGCITAGDPKNDENALPNFDKWGSV